MLDAVGQSNAAAWMDHFRLQSIDTTTNPAIARIAPTMSFAGGAANVATGPRLKRVADTMTQLLGRAVQAELAAPAPRGGAGHDQDFSHASGTDRRGTANGGEASGSSGGGHSGGHSGGGVGGSVDRRDALNLPLVRDVFEIFPDASLIDARKETPPPAKDDD